MLFIMRSRFSRESRAKRLKNMQRQRNGVSQWVSEINVKFPQGCNVRLRLDIEKWSPWRCDHHYASTESSPRKPHFSWNLGPWWKALEGSWNFKFIAFIHSMYLLSPSHHHQTFSSASDAKDEEVAKIQESATLLLGKCFCATKYDWTLHFIQCSNVEGMSKLILASKDRLVSLSKAKTAKISN